MNEDGDEEKRLIKELLDREVRFAIMLEAAKLTSIMVDVNEKILFVSNHLLEVTGWKREEVIGGNWFDIFVPPDVREKRRNIHIMTMDGLVEFSQQSDGDIIAKDGSRIMLRWNATPLSCKEKIIAITCVGQEIDVQNPFASLSIKSVVFQDSKKAEAPTVSAPDLIDDYIILSTLGEEKSKVRLAIHRTTEQKVAVKLLNKTKMTDAENERARREVDIMRQLMMLQHPHIVKLIDTKETDTYFILIEEFVSGGELAKYIQEKGCGEEQARKLFLQILEGLACCHRNDIIHRDIKLENILMDGDNIKLIDFGVSNFVEAGVYRNTFCGTPAYAAPEILLGKQYTGPEVDIWSIGVVLYYMLTAQFPFESIGDILKGKYQAPKDMSPECLDLLQKTLTVNKEERITLEELLIHPWVKEMIAEPELKKRKLTEDNNTQNVKINE